VVVAVVVITPQVVHILVMVAVMVACLKYLALAICGPVVALEVIQEMAVGRVLQTLAMLAGLVLTMRVIPVAEEALVLAAMLLDMLLEQAAVLDF
jgi:hypothetical protein